MNARKKTFAVYFLIILIVFQSISGLIGGIGLLIDPSGSYLKMPMFFLRNTPFKDYLIPALVLFFVLYISVFNFTFYKDHEIISKYINGLTFR